MPQTAETPLKRASSSEYRWLRQVSIFWVMVSSGGGVGGSPGLPLWQEQGLELHNPGLLASLAQFHSVDSMAYVECGSCWRPSPLPAYSGLSDIKIKSRIFRTYYYFFNSTWLWTLPHEPGAPSAFWTPPRAPNSFKKKNMMQKLETSKVCFPNLYSLHSSSVAGVGTLDSFNFSAPLCWQNRII